MAFSGMTAQDALTLTLLREDISALVGELTPYEAPFLDWLGTPVTASGNIRHEFIEHYPFPDYIIASAAVNSATAATGILINGLGLSLSVGQLLENESAAPEVLQITSIAGANSILASRNYDGSGIGSLVAGGSFFVRGQHGVEGADHSGSSTYRAGGRQANTVAYLRAELAVSGTQYAYASTVSGDDFDSAKARLVAQAPRMLEREIIRGVLNTTNSLGSNTITRSMKGIRGYLTTINSTVVAASFAAYTHMYIGNLWQEVFTAGASAAETWGIVAGTTFYKNISDLNDTKVQDSNAKEEFKRVIRLYTGPFGQAEIFLSRSLPATELLLVPRERIKPAVARPWEFIPMATAGDNVKGLLIGEYTVEVHCPKAMGRLHS